MGLEHTLLPSSRPQPSCGALGEGESQADQLVSWLLGNLSATVLGPLIPFALVSGTPVQGKTRDTDDTTNSQVGYRPSVLTAGGAGSRAKD